SSLAYLQRFPVDVVKVDRMFVNHLGSDGARGEVLTRGIVALAQAMGLVAIAEGIENGMQARTMAGLGCPLGQGYLFARPLQPTDLELILNDQEAFRTATLAQLSTSDRRT